MTSCIEDKANRQVDSVETQLSEEEDGEQEKVERIKRVFHGLPSPLELTVLFKKEGVQYHGNLLHQTAKRKEYSLSIKKALNLGVYGADLSYAGLFGQHNSAIEYFAASQILAEDLGIGRTFQHKFISRLEENAENKDTLLKVIGDFFLENDTYLKENDQQDISTFVLIGGWIEGMYLGTNIVDKDANVEGIRKIIVDQKTALHNIIVLLINVNATESSEQLVRQFGELETL